LFNPATNNWQCSVKAAFKLAKAAIAILFLVQAATTKEGC